MDSDQIEKNNLTTEEIIRQHKVLANEANEVREKDKILIKNLTGNFYNKKLNVGIGFKQPHGSLLSGDYFDLFKIPDNKYLFVFADISGHGLPAYTTQIRLRSAIALSISNYQKQKISTEFNTDYLISDIINNFTEIMEISSSNDFVSAIFTIIENRVDKYILKFYNRGMQFPFVARRYERVLIDLYDLDKKDKGWVPEKGTIMGYEIKDIIGQKYYECHKCEFVIYEGDFIMYYSDGLVEASKEGDTKNQYGLKNLKNKLIENINYRPQKIVNNIYTDIYKFLNGTEYQSDDMTAILIEFPVVRI